MTGPLTTFDWYVVDPGGVIRPAASLDEFSDWFCSASELPFLDGGRRVAHDSLPGGAVVGTVFLGIDHGFTWGRAPVLFETLVFGGPHDGDQDRYRTHAEALQGHAQVFARLRAES